MERSECVLAAMSPAGVDPHTPVQIQKLLFLLDRNVAADIDGPHFDFAPYDYGPFDKNVYRELEALRDADLVEIAPAIGLGTKTYRLTPSGQARGTRTLSELPLSVQTYIKEVSEFVRSLSFRQLVSAIYDMYPEMSANSVFSTGPR